MGSKRLPASGKPIRKGGGFRPHTFPDGFPGGRSPFRPQNRPIWAFIFRLPSAQLPFTGTPAELTLWLPVPIAGNGPPPPAPPAPGKLRAGCYPMLRNSASGPEIWFPGRISAGFYSGKHKNRPSGRPEACRRPDFDAFPTGILPKSCPEARFPARKPDFRPGSTIA